MLYPGERWTRGRKGSVLSPPNCFLAEEEGDGEKESMSRESDRVANGTIESCLNGSNEHLLDRVVRMTVTTACAFTELRGGRVSELNERNGSKISYSLFSQLIHGGMTNEIIFSGWMRGGDRSLWANLLYDTL